MNNQYLYDIANKVVTHINSIKAISKKLIDSHDTGEKLDRKELLNLAFITKKLMKNYIVVLNALSDSYIDAEERETINDLLEQNKKSISALNQAIEDVMAGIKNEI